jgi:hypothetical protein
MHAFNAINALLSMLSMLAVDPETAGRTDTFASPNQDLEEGSQGAIGHRSQWGVMERQWVVDSE